MTKISKKMSLDCDVFTLCWDNGLILDSYWQEDKDIYVIHITESTFCELWFNIVGCGLKRDCEIHVYHSKRTIVIELFGDDLVTYHKVVVYC